MYDTVGHTTMTVRKGLRNVNSQLFGDFEVKSPKLSILYPQTKSQYMTRGLFINDLHPTTSFGQNFDLC